MTTTMTHSSPVRDRRWLAASLRTVAAAAVLGALLGGCTNRDPGRPPAPTADGGVAGGGGGGGDGVGEGDGEGGAGGGDGSSCLEAYCSRELEGCGTGCQELLQCATSCETDACIDGCVSRASQASLEQAGALLSCFDANCSGDAGSGGGDGGGSGTSTADINRCIDGIAVLCGCSSAADSPCTESEAERYYNGCLAGYDWELFDAFLCLGDRSPSSLEGCLSALETCIPG